MENIILFVKPSMMTGLTFSVERRVYNHVIFIDFYLIIYEKRLIFVFWYCAPILTNLG